MKRRPLAGDRAAMERPVGVHAARLWELDVTVFDPIIAKDVVREAALVDSCTALPVLTKLFMEHPVESSVVNAGAGYSNRPRTPRGRRRKS